LKRATPDVSFEKIIEDSVREDETREAREQAEQEKLEMASNAGVL
jgi:hypothetical protein